MPALHEQFPPVTTQSTQPLTGASLLLHFVFLSAARPPSYLCVLRFGNVHQRLRSRMDYIEELQDGGTIVGDRGFA